MTEDAVERIAEEALEENIAIPVYPDSGIEASVRAAVKEAVWECAVAICAPCAIGKCKADDIADCEPIRFAFPTVFEETP